VRLRTKGLFMFKAIARVAIVVAAFSLLAAGAVSKPAQAQTFNSILSSVAAIGQQILYANYQHAQQPPNTVVGYTQNGGTLYGNGRIVMPNGQTFYPNANGQYPSGQYAYYSPKSRVSSYTYDYGRTGQFDQTHRHGKGHAYAYGHNQPHGANPHRGGEKHADKKKHDDNNQGEKKPHGEKH